MGLGGGDPPLELFSSLSKKIVKGPVASSSRHQASLSASLLRLLGVTFFHPPEYFPIYSKIPSFPPSGNTEIDDLQTIDDRGLENRCPSPAVSGTTIFNNVDADNNSFFSSNGFPCDANCTANMSKWSIYFEN